MELPDENADAGSRSASFMDDAGDCPRRRLYVDVKEIQILAGGKYFVWLSYGV